MRKTILLGVFVGVFLVSLSYPAVAQNDLPESPGLRTDPEWVKVFKAGGFIPEDIQSDNLGNIYATGTFNSTMEFEDGTIIENKNETFNRIANTFFLIKLDSLGNLIWANYGLGKTRTYGVELDSHGNPYIVGEVFSSGLVFKGTNTTSESLNKPADVSSRGIFIAKYNSMGKLLASSFYTNNEMETPQDFIIDHNDNLIIAGNGFYNVNSELKRKFLVAKFNSDLELSWIKTGENQGRSQFTSVSMDKKGNIYCSGGYTHEIKLDSISLSGEVGNQVVMISKFSSAGKVLWAKSLLANDKISNVHGVGQALITDKNGNSYVAGAAHSRQFLTRISKKGKVKWLVINTGRFSSSASKILFDHNKNLLICGQGMGSSFTSTNANSLTYKSKGATDFYIVKYSVKGQLKSLQAGGGLITDYADAITISKNKWIVLGHLLGGETQFNKVKLTYRNKIMWIASFPR